MENTQEAQKKSTTTTTTTEDTASKWCDPPPDIIPAIADHLDRDTGVGLLRSVCKSWRLSLSSFPPTITFPLFLPVPPSSSSSSNNNNNHSLSLLQRTTYLLSPLSPTTTTTTDEAFFLMKVQKTADNPTTFSLLNTLSSHEQSPHTPSSPISLLDYRVTPVCNSYAFSSDSPQLFKKVVVARNFFQHGDFVVLGLNFEGELLLWKLGGLVWIMINTGNRRFDDIISFQGRFYGIADRKGRLVMIDSRLNPVDMVSNLMYGNGHFAYLVECDGNLFIVDRKDVGDGGVKFGVFKLDDKGRFWDYEPNLNGGVFFLGEDANFALSRKCYGGVISDAIFFKDAKVGNGQMFDGWPRVRELSASYTSYVIGNNKFSSLLSRPWRGVSGFVDQMIS